MSQLLGSVLDTTGPEVANALAKILEDEQKLREAEADMKGKEAAGRDVAWPMQPTMSDYCGLQDADDVYLIAELKNRDLACEDFSTTPAERHACSDCAHRVAASGPDEDRATEQMYLDMIAGGIATKTPTEGPQSRLKDLRSGVAARRAVELQGAYFAKGRMLTKPGYLDYCGYYSTPDEYAVCVLQNPYNTCPQWNAAAAPSVQSAPAGVGVPTVAAPVPPLTGGIWNAQPGAMTTFESGTPLLGSVSALSSSISAAPSMVQAQPSEPFLVEPGLIYKHPENSIALFTTSSEEPDVGVIRTNWSPESGVPFGADEADNAEIIGRWVLSAFAPGVWTQLHDDAQHPVPLTLNVQPPATVYAAWYEAAATTQQGGIRDE
jgi:hypothetical protein